MTGQITALAVRSERRAPMRLLTQASITTEAGLQGDYKGQKHKTRQVTLLAQEDWDAALSDLRLDGAALPWTVRRANIFMAGLRLPRAKGARLRCGDAELEVTGQTYPCRRMDEAHDGLLKALAVDWRGGVTCTVVAGGHVQVGSSCEILFSPPEIVRRLP